MILELTVFLSGAVVMMLEMVGSRIMAPYVGTSIIVWTSLIGVILGCLSIGYYWGGKLADKNPNYKSLASIIFIAALFIALIAVIKEPALKFLSAKFTGIQSLSVIATIILFAAPSILLGIVSPYAIRLKMKSIKTSGQAAGTLYAFSTLGSIIGTFLAGFYLIALIGHTKLLLLLALILIFTSALVSIGHWSKSKIVASVIIILLIPFIETFAQETNTVEIDTAYSRVTVELGGSTRSMKIGKNNSSAMNLNSDELVYGYTKYYDLFSHFNPDAKSAMMIGGAAYSYPKHFLNKYPQSTIDVVEIDPRVTQIARDYFRLQDHPKLSIIHEDGRTFLNRNTKKYDAILIDAFKSLSAVPYQLTTREAVQKVYDSLSENGVVLANIISSVEGTTGKFLRAEVATYKEVFPQVHLFLIQKPGAIYTTQNLMMVALKSSTIPSFTSLDPQLNEFLSHHLKKEITNDMLVLTDDYAPVDSYMMEKL